MSGTYKLNASVKEHTKAGALGVMVEYDYDHFVPNEAMRGTHRSEFEPYPKKFGKGEWIANTLEDAKQMAIDFSDGVS